MQWYSKGPSHENRLVCLLRSSSLRLVNGILVYDWTLAHM